MADLRGRWVPGVPVDCGVPDGPRALSARSTLRLTRDAIGHHSLFWAATEDGFVFGSRLHDVVADRAAPVRIRPEVVATYLSYSYVPGADTLVEGVYAVPPGVTAILRAGGPELQVDWSLPPEPPLSTPPPTAGELRSSLREAVGRCLPAGAATLSGGIDSSLVLALAREAGARPAAFSVSFGEGHANELEWSALVARHLDVPHEVVETTPDAVMRHFDTTVHALSEPNGDPLTVPNALLFAAAGDSAVLNGEGGDPCFGGPKNGPMLLAEMYGGATRETAYLLAHQRCYEDLAAMLEPGIPTDHLTHRLQAWFTDPRWPTFLNRLMAVNIVFKGAWHILPKVEHLGRGRARSPLFDREVVEFSTRIPGPLKRAGAVEKYLLKECVRDLLPGAVVDRPKSGMMVPVEAWFSGPLLPWARERLLDGLALRRLVKREWLEALLDAKLGGLRPRRGIKIWQLLTLEAWLRGVGA